MNSSDPTKVALDATGSGGIPPTLSRAQLEQMAVAPILQQQQSGTILTATGHASRRTNHQQQQQQYRQYSTLTGTSKSVGKGRVKRKVESRSYWCVNKFVNR